MEAIIQASGVRRHAAGKKSWPLFLAWQAPRCPHHRTAQTYELVILQRTKRGSAGARKYNFRPLEPLLVFSTSLYGAVNPDAVLGRLSALHVPAACVCGRRDTRH